MDKNKAVISGYKLQKEFLGNITPYKYQESDDVLYIQQEENLKYEVPNLLLQQSSVDLNEKNPNIILISAAGATGKTELVKYLSYIKQMPVVNLTLHPAVGAASLTGLMIDRLGVGEFSRFVQNVELGNKGLLIDALDEANLKVNNNGFFSFLDDIIKWAISPASIVIFGRTEVIGLAYEYMQEKSVPVTSLQIAPFTKTQAQSFINKQTGKNESNETYRDLRDYIIDTVESFFEKEGDLSRKQCDLFLGYAPVLLAISRLIIQNKNYLKLLNEIKEFNQTKVDLILSIIDYILDREKSEKIDTVLLPDLLSGRSDSFIALAKENCYNKIEQCYRIFCRITNKNENTSPTEDLAFNDTYNKRVSEWSAEHPFLVDGSMIQNIVFESYVLLQLVKQPQYQSMVLDYLIGSHKNSYMLFFLYASMEEDGELKSSLIPFLYDSLKSIDRIGFCSSLYIDTAEETETAYKANVHFAVGGNDDSDEYCYTTEFNKNDVFVPGRIFSNVYFNVPVDFLFSDPKIQLTAPIEITCRNLLVNCNYLTFNSINTDDTAFITCDNIDVDYQKAGIVDLDVLNFSANYFGINSSHSLPHPFINYHTAINSELHNDLDLMNKYKKMRAMVSMFRKHSRNEMGKLHDKIDNRIGVTPIGRAIINAFIEKGIMHKDGHLYIIDDEAFSNNLGLTYASLKSFEFGNKIKKFLNDISL